MKANTKKATKQEAAQGEEKLYINSWNSGGESFYFDPEELLENDGGEEVSVKVYEFSHRATVRRKGFEITRDDS